MQITVLGNGSGGPFQGRHYSAQVLELGGQIFIIDCGEGTQMQLYHHRVRIDHCRQIFISHLHGDHVFGLMGLLTNWCLKQRTTPLDLYAPPGLQELVEHSSRLCGVRYPYPINFIEVDASRHALIFENKQIEVWSIPLNHRMPTSGWLFREKPRARNILKTAIEAYDIPFTLIPGIKAGADLHLPDGRIIPNADLTKDPPAPRTYAYCSDTAPSNAVLEAVRGVDLLYHEATFSKAHSHEASVSFHSTAEQAATVARIAGVGRLLLGHFSGRYTDTDTLLEEARAIFPQTYISVEGERVEV
jgi:ribonuclease Z